MRPLGRRRHGRGLARARRDARPKRRHSRSSPQSSKKTRSGSSAGSGRRRLLASLNHPNIATVYGIEPAGGSHVLALELVEGQTLAERIAEGAMPVREALPVFRQIAAALEAAHDAGIVHRDLKPSNVIVTPEGPREGPRLRPREALRRPFAFHRRGVADSDPARHRGGRRPRNRGLHEPRAGARPRRGPPHGRLGVRLHALRGALRPDLVRRRDAIRHARARPRARAGLGGAAGRHPAPRPPAPATVSPEGRGGTPPRHGRRASPDRRSDRGVERAAGPTGPAAGRREALPIARRALDRAPASPSASPAPFLWRALSPRENPTGHRHAVRPRACSFPSRSRLRRGWA